MTMTLMNNERLQIVPGWGNKGLLVSRSETGYSGPELVGVSNLTHFHSTQINGNDTNGYECRFKSHR